MKKRQITALLMACVTLAASASMTGCKGKYAAGGSAVTEAQGGGQTEAGASGQTSGQTGGQASYKDTLTVAIQDDLKTFDPQNTNKINYFVVQYAMYDYLVSYDPDTQTFSPSVATSWEYPDDTTMMIHLRDDVYFHNGDKLTAEDVLFSFTRGSKMAVSASTFSFLDAENSKVIDDTTLELKFKQPYAQALYVMSDGRGAIVPKKYMEEVGEDAFAIKPMGSGHYVFGSWTSGTEIRMTRNENYWGEKAKTENLVFKVIPEASNRVIELETGGVDGAYEISGSDVARINEMPNAHVVMGPGYRYYTLTFSMQDEILQNQDLRYAISYAIDKESLVNAVFAGTAEPATGFYPANVFAFKEFGVLPYDLDKAKEYMEKAGYPDGLTLKFDYEPREQDRALAEAIQNMVGKIGIKLEMYEMDSATYTANGNEFQMGMRNGNSGEPSNILIIYDSAFADKLQGNDDWLDEQLALAKTLYDDKERAAKYQEIQDYLYEKRYTVPYAFSSVIYGVGNQVEGWQCHPNQMVKLWEVSVKE